MKLNLLLSALFAAFTLSSVAQSNLPPTFIKGTIGIQFNTRSQAAPVKGVKDVYTIDINVANSAAFQGTITDTPQIIEGWVSKAVVQPRALNYDVACDVINPKNPAQRLNAGKMSGRVGIDSDGTAVGKPLVRPANWYDNLSLAKITRTVNGKPVTLTLKKYDKMEFRQHVVAAGPAQIYQPVTVNGELFYDYDKSCWFFNNVTIQYAEQNQIKVDRLSGTIRWDKASNAYQFDVRVNEAPPSLENAFAASTASDESAFFEVDNSLSTLTGKMLYKDRKDAKGNTLASDVTVDLLGSKLTKQQTMSLCKVLLFSTVVPMNAD
jgi:hypothetical protein